MDLTALLGAPWMQPLLGLLVTAVASWLGTRQHLGGGISQSATTHGADSPITQTVNQHTWQVAPPPSRPSPAAAPPPTSSTTTSTEEDLGRVLTFGFALIAGVAALTWLVAANWTAFATTLRAAVFIALFVIALTWYRWPTGVTGAWPLRVFITAAGSATLWALTVLPIPAGAEPGLADIDSATRGMDLGGAVGRTISILGMSGILTYEVRLLGLVFLLAALVTMSARAVGAVLAASAVRRQPPRMWLITLGNRLMGSTRPDFGYFALFAVLIVVGVLLLHPDSAGWLVSHLSAPPDRAP